tara:strand:+ start:164 stop:337 length:174 start_codon:yes stop_codon:yes gene_type:complete
MLTDGKYYKVVYEDWSVILKTYGEVKKLWDTELSHNLSTMPVVKIIDKPKKEFKGFS